MVRCFLAINLSPETKDFLSETIEHFRPLFRKRVRWVKPENCHLTLKFLGEIQEEKLASIEKKARDVAKNFSPFELSLSATGVFPNPKFPRVLWLGLKGDLPVLKSLQANIEDSLSTIGFEPEKRPFSPHVTIGRVKARGANPIELKDFLTLSPPLLRTPVKDFALYQSILHPSGPEYRELISFPLTKSK